MGLFGDLFKSRKEREIERRAAELEREKAKRREQSKAKMKAEKAINDARDQIARLEADNAKSWEKARELVKSGRKSAARIELSKYRAVGRLIEQFEKKVWVMQFFETRLESAGTDEALTEALGAFSKLMEVDPEKTLDTLEDVAGTLDEVTEIDRIWNGVFEGEVRKDSRRDSAVLPDVDGLMDELEREAAWEIDGAPRGERAASEDVARGVASGREKLNRIMDDDEKKR